MYGLPYYERGIRAMYSEVTPYTSDGLNFLAQTSRKNIDFLHDQQLKIENHDSTKRLTTSFEKKRKVPISQFVPINPTAQTH